MNTMQTHRALTPTLSAPLLALLLAAVSGCSTRTPADMKALPASQAKFSIHAPCTPAAAHAVVPDAASTMELTVEEPSPSPGTPWILFRSRRLADPHLWFRVDVTPAAAQSTTSVITIYSAPVPPLLYDTQETIAMPGALAMRIVAACATSTSTTIAQGEAK